MRIVGRGAGLLAGSALAVCVSTTPAEAADGPSLDFGLRLQGWYVAEQRGAADGGTAHDFLLRRGYLAITGKLNSTVSAFAHVSGDRIGQAGLDAPGLGLGTGLALRDAWIAWQPSAAFRVQAGRMYVPFTRAFGTESTFALLAVDLPQAQGGGRGALFYPSKVGRDDGVVVWGVPWRGRLQYRLGVMEGVEGQANPGDSLRLAGRLSVNLLEAETAWFNRGTYLGEKRVLAFGLGFDRQTGLVLEGTERTYRAWTADAFLDHPIGRGALTIEASYTDAEGLPQGLAFAGLAAGADARTAYVQAGYLLPWTLGPGRIQVYGRTEHVLVEGTEDASLPSAGLSYFVRGHDLKVSVDWSRSTRGTRPASNALTLQAQVAF
jgi:hypothetical protein